SDFVMAMVAFERLSLMAAIFPPCRTGPAVLSPRMAPSPVQERRWRGRTCSKLLLAILGFSVAAIAHVSAEGPDAHANRLLGSANPYLLQHAQNPVDWYPWGPEAIARAKAENKVVSVSVGYSTCFWCHIAERTVYRDRAIAELMNKWFINVKVDREERPDLDAIFMAARRRLTGRGGWPNNLFLTPDLKPFFAAGHIPAQGSGGAPSFAEVLRRVHTAWQSNPERLKLAAEHLHSALARQSEGQGPPAGSPAQLAAEWPARAPGGVLPRRH